MHMHKEYIPQPTKSSPRTGNPRPQGQKTAAWRVADTRAASSYNHVSAIVCIQPWDIHLWEISSFNRVPNNFRSTNSKFFPAFVQINRVMWFSKLKENLNSLIPNFLNIAHVCSNMELWKMCLNRILTNCISYDLRFYPGFGLNLVFC